MKPTPQALSFDCQDTDFCQPILQEQPPVYQFDAYCPDELTGSLEKQECETPVAIDNMAETFVDLVGFLASDSELTPVDGEDHTAFSDPDFFIEGFTYQITWVVKNCTRGTYGIKAGNNNTQSLGAGVHTEIITATGSNPKIGVVGINDSEDELDGQVTNIIIRCIRYSALFEVSQNESEDPSAAFEFVGQTKICKIRDDVGVDIIKQISEVIEGKIYKLSFKITGNTCNGDEVELAYGLAGSGPFIEPMRNGLFELLVVAGSNVNKELFINLPTCSDGCIEDITLYQQNEVRIGWYDLDDNFIEEIETELVDDEAIIASLPDDLPLGCGKIGYADACGDFHGQFSGNSIVEPETPREFIGITKVVNDYLFDVGERAIITYRNILYPGILYNGRVSCGFVLDPGQYLQVKVTAGGNTIIVDHTPPPSGPPYTGSTSYNFEFEIESGTRDKDLVIEILTTAETSDAEQGFVEVDSISMVVDEDPQQLIPEFFSNCFNVLDSIDDCEYVEVKFRNDNPVYGLKFGVGAFDYVRFWVEAKLWHPNYTKEREVYKDANGRRTVNYSDSDKVYKLTTAPIPEYLFDTIALGMDCDEFLVNEREFVGNSDELAPSYNKNIDLAPVEIDLVEQNVRSVKSYC